MMSLIGRPELEIGLPLSNLEVEPNEYNRRLRENSVGSTAWEDPITIISEKDEELPTNISIGNTITEQTLPDNLGNPGDPSGDNPVNRLLNIKKLGAKIGSGATNTGYEVYEVEGMPDDIEINYPLVLKAQHYFHLNRRADNIVYHVHQASLMHSLSEVGVGPVQLGLVMQEIPTKDPTNPNKNMRYMVPVMEKVGEADINDILRDIPVSEIPVLKEALLKTYQTANNVAQELGYTIGDHGIRVTRTEEGYKAWLIDVGWVPVEIGLDFDPYEIVESITRQDTSFQS